MDTQTDHFVQFSGQGRFDDLQIQRRGSDFFADLLENVRTYVYPEDRTRVALSVEKQAVLVHLASEHRFSITYRMMIEGEPVYYNIKAVRADINDPRKVVVGISNVDDQIHPGNVGHQEVDKKLDFFRVAYALSDAFEAVYYVDLATGAYTEFTAEGEYEKLPLHIEGKDFFEETAANIRRVVFRDDQKNVAEQMGKVNLLRRLESGGIGTLSYRLVIQGEVVHYKLRMARMNEDRHKVVISVGRDTSYELERTVSYSAIVKSLAADYFSIYYVDLETEEFTQYTAHTDYMGLEIEDTCVDFFATTRRNVLRVVYQDDVERALAFWHKDTLVPQLEGGKPGVITYRLIMDGRPVYVEFKVTLMKGQEDAHMVVGISNVDEQVRREMELGAAKELANRDALTGVKSKHAYDNTVRELNLAIEGDAQTAFAMVVCDVNDLKRVNDSVGHAAGDQYIRDACMMVCKTFTHSPVFRIGGDEFVAILRGADYDNRLALMDLLEERNRQSREASDGSAGSAAGSGATSGRVTDWTIPSHVLKPVVASDMAEYMPGRDTTVEEVFRRADEIMYERKRQMKG